jgi:2'-5' RNA ligase
LNTKRLFFALWPDHRQRDRLRDVIGPVAKTVEGRMVDRRDWHITLAFIGTFPANRVPFLLERAAGIRVEPFRLIFDRLEFWPRPRVASLCAASVPPELQALVDSLNSIMLDLGLHPEDRIYRPHITVVRNARHFETERLMQRAVFEWSAFELVESISGPGGVRYEPLKQ